MIAKNANKFLRQILILPLLGSLAACQTTSILNFQSLNAPTIVLPSDVKTIGFVDRNISFSKDTTGQYFLFNELLMKDTTEYTEEMADYCYLGFKDNLSEAITLDTIPFFRLPSQFLAEERNYPAMEWTDVDSICQIQGSDILIALEDIQIYNKYSTIENEEGRQLGFTDISYFSVWRIYDPLYQKYYDERIVVDSLFSEVYSNSYKKLVEQELPKRKDLFRDVSYELGKEYALLLSPQWADFSRRYFIAGDDRFAVANYYLNQENWEKAISIWEEIADENNFKLSGRACFNLALAYEIKEDFTSANQWLRRAVSSYKKLKSLPSEFKWVEQYFPELIKRYQNKKSLNTFFGE